MKTPVDILDEQRTILIKRVGELQYEVTKAKNIVFENNLHIQECQQKITDLEEAIQILKLSKNN